MKNQIMSLSDINKLPEFLDIKNAKNPIYQPMAGKSIPCPDNRAGSKDETLTPESGASQPKATAVQLDGQKEIKDQEAKIVVSTGKPALNLEGTLKLVEELHRLMVQRGRLVYTIDNLDRFEIERKEEAEDNLLNYYQGCELEITDDKRNKFSTKNPVIIKAVSLFVRNLCLNRLAEIEAEITIPA